MKAFRIDDVRDLMQTKPGTAVFWSGTTGFSMQPEMTDDEYKAYQREFGGEECAKRYARSHGGETLEMKMEQHKEELIKAGFPYDSENDTFIYNDDTRECWEQISTAFAEGASGDVRVLYGDDLNTLWGDPDENEGTEYESIWAKREYGQLLSNDKITSITAIDPFSGEKTRFFDRNDNLMDLHKGKEFGEQPEDAENVDTVANKAIVAENDQETIR